MSLDKEILELVSKDGTMDYAKWPSLLGPLIERLDHIVQNDFPMPKPTPELTQSFEPPISSLRSSYPVHETNSQPNSNKENAPPPRLQSSPARPPVPPFYPVSVERIPDPQAQSCPIDDTLPPQLFALLSSIKSTLNNSFSLKPPHTIQRLAELILHPTCYYKTLPAYLRAVDRVVSVSSGADIFPLPLAMPLPGSMVDSSLANGVNGIGSSGFMFSDSALGSDESLGGALLTPIPWLNSSDLPGGASPPNSSASEPTPLGESGVLLAPLQQQQRTQQLLDAVSIDTAERDLQFTEHVEDDEVTPHARGPAILGVEDLGLQDGKGVQISLPGISSSISTVSSITTTDPCDAVPVSADCQLDCDNATRRLDRDADGDVVFRDAEKKGSGDEEAHNAVPAAIPGPVPEGGSMPKSGTSSGLDGAGGATNCIAVDDVNMGT